MMTWLSEIEKELDYCSGEKGISYLCDCVKRLARVSRELAGHIEDAKAWAEHAGIYLVDGIAGDDPVLERLRMTAFKSWNNLSPDAKELVE